MATSSLPTNKWELVLDSSPKPIAEHLLSEAGKLFAKDLSAWPLPVDSLEGPEGEKLAALFAQWPERPDSRLFKQAFHLARLELGREQAAYDAYLRNQGWLEAGLTSRDKPMLLFLHRYITEHLLSLGEATEGRLNRAKLLVVLGHAERGLFGGVES